MESTNEHPILFNAEMIRAILDGRKTQTRRVIKPQPSGNNVTLKSGVTGYWIGWDNEGDEAWNASCPYGKSGDRLWVREEWRTENVYNAASPKVISETAILQFRADMGMKWIGDRKPAPDEWGKWRRSIHMPRWASRITLDVKDIRVEQVQDIGEENAVAEGIPFDSQYFRAVIHPVKGTLKHWPTANMAFGKLWDSINAEKGFGWDQNPYVWVIEFEKVR